ncbi:hypothetical protein GF324_10140 [bacterium]|nr:hypothetical protein [bacterium]
MTLETFERWLARYKSAWEERDPQAATALFAHDARYYETPFSEPFTGHDGIRRYWEEVPHYQRNIRFDYTILAVEGIFGYSHWSATFERIQSGEAVRLDGILQVEMNEDGLCTDFREWWHRLEGGKVR